MAETGKAITSMLRHVIPSYLFLVRDDSTKWNVLALYFGIIQGEYSGKRTTYQNVRQLIDTATHPVNHLLSLVIDEDIFKSEFENRLGGLSPLNIAWQEVMDIFEDVLNLFYSPMVFVKLLYSDFSGIDVEYLAKFYEDYLKMQFCYKTVPMGIESKFRDELYPRYLYTFRVENDLRFDGIDLKLGLIRPPLISNFQFNC